MGVAGGYLLGRTKKLRLALALGGLLAGRRLMSEGQGLQGLMGQGSKLLESNPQLKELQNQVTGHLVEAAREAALVAAASRIEALTKSLQERQQAGGEQGEGTDLGSALEGVTGALGLKGKGESGSEEQPQDRGEEEPGEEESGEEESGEEESGEQPQDRGEEESGEEESGEEPQGRGGERGQGEQESAEEESPEKSDASEQSSQRERLRGRLRRRRPEGSKGSGRPRRPAPSEDDATPRDVAKKVSAKKASAPPAEKGR